jgi:hypothetical protein
VSLDEAVWVFVGALAFRSLYLASVKDAYFFVHLQTEALRYDEWALLILGGDGSPSPPFEQAPGFPYFVAAVYAVAGHHVLAVALTQVVLGAASCAMIAVAAGHWFGRREGLWAGALAAAFGPLIYFTGEVLPPTLFVFVLLAAVMAAQRSRWLLSGCLWGAALIVRSEVVFALPLVCFDAWRRGGRKAVLATVSPVLAVFGAFILANAIHGTPSVVLTTSGGLNLWLGNNPDADGVNPFAWGRVETALEAVHRDAASVAAADSMFRRRALEFWANQPLDASALIWKKFWWTWSNRELPNTIDIDWQETQSWLFGSSPAFPLGLGAVLPLAAAGAATVGRTWRRLPLLVALLAIGLGSSVLFFTNSRFRLPMAPALLMLAGAGAERIWRMAAAWRKNQGALTRATLAACLGAVAAWNNAYGVRSYRVPELTINVGILEREAGHLDAAADHLREGLAARPRDSMARIHLALALEQRGDLQPALQAYAEGIALAPDDGELREMAGRFLVRNGLEETRLTDRTRP